MGMAEDLRAMAKEINEMIAAVPTTVGAGHTMNREEAEKLLTRFGQAAKKLDSIATSLSSPPVVDPLHIEDAKHRPGGPKGDR